MPSSQKTLTAKLAARDLLLAQKDAELVAQAAEILTLRMQVGALENLIGFQNGAFQEMKHIIEKSPGGTVAKLSFVLGRHGFNPERPEGSPFQ